MHHFRYKRHEKSLFLLNLLAYAAILWRFLCILATNISQ